MGKEITSETKRWNDWDLDAVFKNGKKEERKIILKKIDKWWNKLTGERMGYRKKFYTLDMDDIQKLKEEINSL